jgi:AcrR family transcriptional regulator
MNHVANSAARPYRSQLRAQQARDTRERILDATLRVIATGIASVSIPAVAREAGVSIPTVYRNFKTKRELLESVYPHAVQRAGLVELTVPTSLEELRAGYLSLFNRVESFDNVARAAMANPAVEEIRHLDVPGRVRLMRRFADTVAPELAPGDRRRIARLLVILATSASLRMWRNHMGLSVDEAADDVDWVVRSVIAGAANGKSSSGPAARRER